MDAAYREDYRLSPKPPKAADETGLALLEAVIASSLLIIVVTALMGLLTSSVVSSRLSKERTVAEQGVANAIEQIRSMNYDLVGTTNGNPAGTLAASQPFAGVQGQLIGIAALLTTRVTFADSNVPASYASGADYKTVVVAVTRKSDGKVLAQSTTELAPPTQAAQNTATVKATVVDAGNNTAIPNVAVALANGPSLNRSDVSDIGGVVSFAGLTPNPTSGTQAYYDVTATPPAGYVALAGAHVQLAPTQTYNTSLQLYRPVTVTVNLLNPDGSTFTGAATITLTSSRGTATSAYSGSPVTLTALDNGEKLMPGLAYTASVAATYYTSTPQTANVPTGIYPTSLSGAFSVTMTREPGSLNVSVVRSGKNCKNATVTLAGGPGAVNLTATTTSSGGPAVFNSASVVAGPAYTITGKSAVTGVSASSAGNVLLGGSNAFTVTLASGSSTC